MTPGGARFGFIVVTMIGMAVSAYRYDICWVLVGGFFLLADAIRNGRMP